MRRLVGLPRSILQLTLRMLKLSFQYFDRRFLFPQSSDMVGIVPRCIVKLLGEALILLLENGDTSAVF